MTENKPLHFLLIDDHVVVRSGLKFILSDHFKPCSIDEAEDGESALKRVQENRYDLIMLDIKMPNTNTLQLMEHFKATYPALNVIIFSMNSESVYAKRFLRAGARGFVNKDASLGEVVKAIRQVLNGKRYISETLIELLAEFSHSYDEKNPFDILSRREFEIVSLILAGETIGHIAQSLNLQASTVGTHKARIFEKLQVSNLIELKELAASLGL
jgi:two-component system, NarL family, invasion response regulator UvrY